MGSFGQQFSGRGVTFLKKKKKSGEGIHVCMKTKRIFQIMLRVLAPTEQGLGFL